MTKTVSDKIERSLNCQLYQFSMKKNQVIYKTSDMPTYSYIILQRTLFTCTCKKMHVITGSTNKLLRIKNCFTNFKSFVKKHHILQL